MNQSFLNLMNELKLTMVSDHVSVDAGRNPVAARLSSGTSFWLRHVLEQYSWFSKSIVTFLMAGYYAVVDEGWATVASELRQNIGEELGGVGLDDGKAGVVIPHYILLKRGMYEGLGVDVGNVAASPVTEAFVSSIRAVAGDTRAAYVAGVMCALETSAVPELEMVYGFARRLFMIHGVPMPDGVRIFFESHINELEVGHENRLREACAEYVLSPEQKRDFAAGFEIVMNVMDKWWQGLAIERHPSEWCEATLGPCRQAVA